MIQHYQSKWPVSCESLPSLIGGLTVDETVTLRRRTPEGDLVCGGDERLGGMGERHTVDR